MTVRRERAELVADFETTTDSEDCRVWAWGLGNVDDSPWFRYGNSIEGFVNLMSSMDSIVYFHNLGFDMFFILDWMLNNGYSHVDKNARRGEFSTLIDRMGKAYTIDVTWTNGRKTQFRDSLKRIPMRVKDIAKTFDLPILKGDLDYHAKRERGHVLTGQEVDYLKNDVHIVAMALAIQKREGMTKLTVGSDAMASYKSLGPADWFRDRFPLIDEEWDAEIRKAYRGGFTYADPRFQGRILGEGHVYDVNSLYPSVMQQQPIPWGVPQRYGTLAYARGHMNPGDFFVTRLVFGAVLKDDHIPCIQVKGSNDYRSTEYQRVISPGTEMWVCSTDLEVWHEQYDLTIEEAGETYVFRTTTGLFNDYIERWGEIKRNSFGGRRAIAKLFLRPNPTVFTGSLQPTPIAPGKYQSSEMVSSRSPWDLSNIETLFTQRQAWQSQPTRARSPFELHKPTMTALPTLTRIAFTCWATRLSRSRWTRQGLALGSMRDDSRGRFSPVPRRIRKSWRTGHSPHTLQAFRSRWPRRCVLRTISRERCSRVSSPRSRCRVVWF